MTLPAVKSIEPLNAFAAKLRDGGYSLRRRKIETLQVNLGRKCNQACRHCHVDAAPWRTETMIEPIAHRIVDWIQRYQPPVVDITGGAPELSAFFKFIVENARQTGARVIDRNNLTIIEEDGFADLPEYLAEWQVEIIASLPCYEPENVNKQRGAGVFKKSISALQKLNAAGYGTRLPLHLVYNPVGAQLPPDQQQLENDYRIALWDQFGIVFTGLYTITNQPIARFAEDLKRQGQWDAYSELLVNHFNPATLEDLMCRSTLSVGYDGLVYDCDFNQMLDLPMAGRSRVHLWELDPEILNGLEISTGAHCFACTAGAGSSCGGSLA
jgi:radical SAM/Cys-rich protein